MTLMAKTLAVEADQVVAVGLAAAGPCRDRRPGMHHQHGALARDMRQGLAAGPAMVVPRQQQMDPGIGDGGERPAGARPPAPGARPAWGPPADGA